jgi:small subunit ribosomal protein S1
VKGTIVSVDSNFVTIDVGLKSDGRVSVSEFESDGVMNVGDSIDVYIERYESKNGEIVLSREKALRESAWENFEKCFRDGAHVMGTVFHRVKGGFMVDLSGLTAFLPGSQVDTNPTKDTMPVMGVLQPFVIIKMDKLNENIVVSCRDILGNANKEEREKTMASLEEGQILSGTVKNITNYGAFVDVGGGVDGLLHNSDISWKRVTHTSDVMTPGQKVEVKVIKFNKETGRISFGIKQLTPDPWEGVDTEFVVGTRAVGRVTNITDYGIFVELKEGVEGLVYVSEISWKKGTSPSKAASTGTEIEVIVLDVDVFKRRIGLGIKQLQESPWTKLCKDFPVGHIFDGLITNVTDFGIFVKVNEDVDGMVHVNDLSWEKLNEGDLSKYKIGDTLKVKVLEIDEKRERVALGVKHLVECPYTDTTFGKGDVVTCVVSEIKNDDGISVILTNGAQGFIKKIDLAKDRQDRRTDKFAVGEKVDAKIISATKGKGVVLSIKAMEIEKEKKVMEEYGSSDSGASLGDILGLAIEKSKK